MPVWVVTEILDKKSSSVYCYKGSSNSIQKRFLDLEKVHAFLGNLSNVCFPCSQHCLPFDGPVQQDVRPRYVGILCLC